MKHVFKLLKKHQKKDQCISHDTIIKISKQTKIPIKHIYHKICHHHVAEKDHYAEVKKLLLNKSKNHKHLVVQTSPSSKVSIGEEFNMPPGTIVAGKLVSALKQLGFDKVFDTSLGADITIMEEATELIKRIKNNGPFPLITTCCPAWIRFMELFYWNLIPNMSSCKSPHEMLGFLAKNYYSKLSGIPKNNIIMVSIMPCVAKRFESERPELKSGVDYVLTAQEAAKLIKEFNIDFKNLKEKNYDEPLGNCSGAGAIFAGSGGVMEAALRTACEFYTNKPCPQLEYKTIRGIKGIKKTEIKIDEKKLKCLVINDLNNARAMLKDANKYHFIEIMACAGGCIGGVGQPMPMTKQKLQSRINALYTEDKHLQVRRSHLNPAVQKIYKTYLGKPLGETSKKLLHTFYYKRKF